MRAQSGNEPQLPSLLPVFRPIDLNDFLVGCFVSPVWPRMCVQFQPHCVVVKGVEHWTIGDLSAIDCSHRCTHSSGISVTAC
jgi:hypothetical protein